MSHHPNAARRGMLDALRWTLDLARAVGLGLLGVLFLGHRPRGCRVVPIDTVEGDYHGCGRACRYTHPARFAPLCLNARKRTSEGRELVLCGMGFDPRFSLPFAAFLPIACFLVALGFGLLVLALGEGQDADRAPLPQRPLLTLERLFLVESPEEPAGPPSAPPSLVREQPFFEHAVPPPALERFRKIQAGPLPEDENGRAIKSE